MGFHRHARAKQRRQHVLAEERPVTCIVRVRDERHAGGQQLRARGLDLDDAAVRTFEFEAVIGALALAIFQLGLRHCGAKVDVPERRRFELIGKTFFQQMEKPHLRDALRSFVDRGVGHRPVDGQAEVAPEMLKRLFVFLRQPFTQLDEIRARDREGLFRGLRRRLKAGIVRQRRIASHAVVILHTPLGRQAIVVPSHRIEHLTAAHALKAGHDVGMRVGEDVADMQRPADRRRRRID